MKLKIVLISLLVALGVITGVLYVKNTKQEELTQVYLNELNQKNKTNSLLMDEVKLFENALYQNYNADSLCFDNKQCTTSELKNTTLGDVFNSKRVVFRFSNNDCMDCVYQTLELVDSLSNRIGKDNIVVVAEGYDDRSLLAFGEGNNIKPLLINEPEGLFKGKLLKSPVFFIVDDYLKTSHYFTPDKFLAYRTLQYFNTIQNLFKK